jgi:hypothetical protein
LVGDEVKGSGVVNLKTLLKAEEYTNLVQYLTFMPRSMLWSFFMQKVWPSLPGGERTMMMSASMSGMGGGMSGGMGYESPGLVGYDKTSIYGDTHVGKAYEDLVWAAFVDVFNTANLEYVNKNQLEPWDWEETKTNAYYVSTSKDAIAQMANEIEGMRDVGLAMDPTARKIMEAYALLPKVGDLGLEINRQNAVKELLKKKDYTTAQAIVDAYRYISESEVGPTLTKPIPFNIVNESGQTIAKAT